MQNINQGEYYSRLPLPEEPTVPDNVASPDNPPWTVLEATGVWIASVFFILVIPSIFLLPYLASLDVPITETDQIVEFAKTDPTSIVLQIVAVIPAHLLTLLVAWLVITRVRKFSFRQMLGWEKGGFAWWHYCIILFGFLAAASLVSRFFPEQENDLLRILQSSRTAVYIVAFLATFTAPLVEEVTYRGVLYSAFQRKFGVPAAFFFVTFLFSAIHWPQYWPSYSTIFLLTLLSLTLTAIRVKSKNLLPCIILHTLFNGIQSVILILEPFLKSLEGQEQTAAILRFIR
ncbi:MAG: CPBP family intramembrane metalloprotease [Chloracidobacterium sp.]|nr:CPBP family intramembrane metalloprotease [Chloracidobacterium sp.]